jgi:uncharacterized membrane protein YdjX (TVP38/TMEM64 family)
MTNPGRGGKARGTDPWRLALFLACLAGLVGFALAWSWSPLKNLLDFNLVVDTLRQAGKAYGPWVATLAFAAALTIAVPLTFAALVTIVAMGPYWGFAVTVAGAALASVITFTLGKALGHDMMRRLGGRRVNLVSERLAGHGVLSVIAIRMVPVAPFAIVNMIAGSSHLRLRDMVVGTVIGMTPGTLGMVFFVDPILEAIRNPNTLTVTVIALLLALVIGGIWGMTRWVQTMDGKAPAASGPDQPN